MGKTTDAQMPYLRVRNWARFQHYRTPNPPWIKMHSSLLSDYDFMRLSDSSKAHLILLWLMAARTGNEIPRDEDWIRQQIGATTDLNIDALIASGFVEAYSGSRKSLERVYSKSSVRERQSKRIEKSKKKEEVPVSSPSLNNTHKGKEGEEEEGGVGGEEVGEGRTVSRGTLEEVYNESSKPESSGAVVAVTKPKKRPPGVAHGKYRERAIALLDFLNAVGGFSYQHTDTNIRFIAARLEQGFNMNVLRRMVLLQVREWAEDPRNRKYLRPATLFNDEKCSQYVGQIPPAVFKALSSNDGTEGKPCVACGFAGALRRGRVSGVSVVKCLRPLGGCGTDSDDDPEVPAYRPPDIAVKPPAVPASESGEGDEGQESGGDSAALLGLRRRLYGETG
jgi:uncharacterized phage protein (TIGR02220 family)